MNDLIIFTDGACSGNPGPGGWGCVIAMPEGRVFELAGHAAHTTNNRMELSAAIAALRAVGKRAERVVLHTDSTYVIGGITSWIAGWKRRGWVTAEGQPVKNGDLWRELDELASARGKERLDWRWVKGHAGHDANERCDELAVAGAKRQRIELYDGPLLDYPYGSMLPLAKRALPAHAPRAKSASAEKAWYLSVLDGRLERHTTWKECEARVKGRSGAKFKKVTSAESEAKTLRSWGA